MSAEDETRERSPPGHMIDSHQHFWRYEPSEYAWIDGSMDVIRRDFLPGDAACEMRAVGVSAAIAVQARQTLDETHWLLQLANEHQTIAAVVGWIDLQSDVDAQLAPFASEPKLAGVRHIVQSEPDGFLLRPPFLDGIARLRQFGLTYDILVYARQLRDASAFAARFPEQRFVLDHLGKPEVRVGEMARWRQDLEAVAALPHVWCKLSGLVTEADWTAWTRQSAASVSRRGAECVRTGAGDDGVGLAGLPAGRAIRGRCRPGRRCRGGILSRRTRTNPRRQRRAVL